MIDLEQLRPELERWVARYLADDCIDNNTDMRRAWGTAEILANTTPYPEMAHDIVSEIFLTLQKRTVTQ